MDWFQNKTTQLIALAGIVSTLAGFGYTGATYVNRIENLESKMSRYINEIDALADQVTELDKNVVAVGEQIKSLNVETQELRWTYLNSWRCFKRMLHLKIESENLKM